MYSILMLKVINNKRHYPVNRLNQIGDSVFILHPILFLKRSRVRTGPGKPGESLNSKNKNAGLENPGILLKVLESPGILNRNCKSGLIIKLHFLAQVEIDLTARFYYQF